MGGNMAFSKENKTNVWRSEPKRQQTGAQKQVVKKKENIGVNYKNAVKTGKNFMYKDFKRSHCYDCDFSESNFDYASFRGAHFKSCNFYGASFKAAEFVGTNLKKSRFKRARFEDVVFEGANLEGVDFADATFKNVVFVGCDITQAKNLNTVSVNIKIFEEMPSLEISEALQQAVLGAMENKYIKASRVLDLKDGRINPISMMRLLSHFEEKTLIKGLQLMKGKIDNDFCTLSYIIKFLAKHEAQGLI